MKIHLMFAWYVVAIVACKEESSPSSFKSKLRTRAERSTDRQSSSLHESQQTQRSSDDEIFNWLSDRNVKSLDLRARIDNHAADIHGSSCEVVASTLNSITDDDSLRSSIGVLAGAYPDVAFWCDVTVSLPEGKARRMIVSWIQNIKNEEHYNLVKKAYAKMEPGNDRTGLARALVVYFPGTIDDTKKVLEVMETPDEKYAGLEVLAERIGHHRYVNPDSVSSGLLDWMSKESAGFDLNKRRKLENLMIPKRGFVADDLITRKKGDRSKN